MNKLRKIYIGFFFVTMIVALIYNLSRESIEDSKTAEAVQQLAKFLDSPNFEVRKAAAESLRDVAHRSVVLVVSDKWQKEDAPKVVATLVSALGNTKQDGAVQVISDIWTGWQTKTISDQFADEPQKYGTPAEIEAAAIGALAKINSPISIRTLITLVGTTTEDNNKKVSDAFAKLDGETQFKILNYLTNADKNIKPVKTKEDMKNVTFGDILLIDDPKIFDQITAKLSNQGLISYFDNLSSTEKNISKFLKDMDPAEFNRILEIISQLSKDKSSELNKRVDLIISDLKTQNQSLARISYNELKHGNKDTTVARLVKFFADLHPEFWTEIVNNTAEGKLAVALQKDMEYRDSVLKAIESFNRGQIEKLYSVVVYTNPGLTPRSEPAAFASAFYAAKPEQRDVFIQWLKKDIESSEDKKYQSAFETISVINKNSVATIKAINDAIAGISNTLYQNVIQVCNTGPDQLYPEKYVVDNKMPRDQFSSVWMSGVASGDAFDGITAKIGVYQLQSMVAGLTGSINGFEDVIKDLDKSASKTVSEVLQFTKFDGNRINALKDANWTEVSKALKKQLFADVIEFRKTLMRANNVWQKAFRLPVFRMNGGRGLSETNTSTILEILNNDNTLEVSRAYAVIILADTVSDKNKIAYTMTKLVDKFTGEAKRQINILVQLLGKRKEVWVALKSMLEDNNDRVVRAAAKICEKIGTKDIFDPLLETAKRFKADQRMLAPIADALSKLKVNEAHTYFVNLSMDTKDTDVMGVCLKYISEQTKESLETTDIETGKVIDKYISVLQNNDMKQVFEKTIEAIGVLSTDYAVDKLSAIYDMFEKEKNEKLMAQVVLALGKSKNTKALPIIEKALKSESLLVQEKAAEALGKIKDKESVAALINVLKTPKFMPKIVFQAMTSLVQLKYLKSASVEKSADDSIDKEQTKPLSGAESLDLTGGSFEAITNMMKSENERDVILAIEAFGLGKLGEDPQKETKVRNIKHYIYPFLKSDKSVAIRRAAADAMNSFTERKCAEDMAAFIYSEENGSVKYNETDEVTVAKLCTGLGIISEPRCRKNLEDKLSKIDNPNNYPIAACSLADVIGLLKGEGEIKYFIEWIKKPETAIAIRLEFLKAWMDIDKSEGLDVVLDLVQNESDDRVRYAAIVALEKYSNKTVRTIMTNIVENENARPSMRVSAANCLVLAENRDTFKLLEKYLNDGDSEIRAAIANAMVAKNLPHFFNFYNIQNALTDKDDNTLIAICEALTVIDYSPHRDDLAKLYSHQNPEVRANADKAIKIICDVRRGDYANYLIKKVQAVADMEAKIANGEINESWQPIK